MVGENVREEYESEEDAWEYASRQEIVSDESSRFLYEDDGEDGDAEEEESFDADKREERRWEEHSEIIRHGHLLEECHESERKEEEEKDREVFGEGAVEEKERDETSGEKYESVPGHFRSECPQKEEEREK